MRSGRDLSEVASHRSIEITVGRPAGITGEARMERAGLRVGSRVVVRYRLPTGSATDALGELTHADNTVLVVRTRRGPVSIAVVDVIAAKEVPPPPPSRHRPG
jgi:hypothetical protein